MAVIGSSVLPTRVSTHVATLRPEIKYLLAGSRHNVRYHPTHLVQMTRGEIHRHNLSICYHEYTLT